MSQIYLTLTYFSWLVSIVLVLLLEAYRALRQGYVLILTFYLSWYRLYIVCLHAYFMFLVLQMIYLRKGCSYEWNWIAIEFENENFIRISLLEPISDDDGDATNTKTLKTVTNEGPIEVQKVAYEKKKRGILLDGMIMVKLNKIVLNNLNTNRILMFPLGSWKVISDWINHRLLEERYFIYIVALI